MSEPRHLPPDHHARHPAASGPPPVAAGAAGAPVAPVNRAQPPLQEVLQGLDARELEGQTVFDQLFGPLPEGDPRLPGG